MKQSDVQQPAEESLRRPSSANRAVRGACAAAAVFGALNFGGTLLWGSVSALDALALVTLVAGAAGAAGNRRGAYVTVAALGITLGMLALFGIALVTGQTIEVTAPDWVRVDISVVISIVALWCVTAFSVLVFGLWMDSSGRK